MADTDAIDALARQCATDAVRQTGEEIADKILRYCAACEDDTDDGSANYHMHEAVSWIVEAFAPLVERARKAEQELSHIDAVLARRPALDRPTRCDNILKAISVAATADELRVKLTDAEHDRDLAQRMAEGAEHQRAVLQAKLDAMAWTVSDLRGKLAAFEALAREARQVSLSSNPAEYIAFVVRLADLAKERV